MLVGRAEAEQLKVTMEDFDHALQYDLKPAFGISDEQLDRYVFNGVYVFRVNHYLNTREQSVSQYTEKYFLSH